MPKTEINYYNTIIYRIICKDLDVSDAYIGHTTNFIKRKNQHKAYCIYNTTGRKTDLKIYKTIKDNGGWDNWDMIEIEKYPCIDANEARARERYWYEQHNSTLNVQKPNRSRDEYKIENKEKIKEANREYFQNNKQQIYEHRKVKREENKNEHNAKQKEYRQLNKDVINERKKEVITCICGCVCSKNSLARHKTRKQHLKFLETIN